MARKEAPVTSKIIIDLSEYLSLLSLQDKVNRQQALITARLASETKPVLSSEPRQDSEELSQSGKGATVSEETIKDISQLVLQQLKSQFNFIPLHQKGSPSDAGPSVQSGSGTSDLVEKFAEEDSTLSPEKAIDILPQASIVQKSQLSDNFDDENLLKVVPSIFQEKAKKLLVELKKHPSDFTYTSKGTIFLNETSLSDSNIYDLFPKLFKTVAHPEKIPHLLELVTVIATLGLASYINGKLLMGLVRKKTILNHSELKERINSGKLWYYLGE
jgi:hypothetical protein